MISDTHIDSKLPAGKWYLSQAFRDMESSEVKNDAVVVCGDFTNYGEEQGIFLDKELSEAAATGLPAFVVCHKPIVGQNDQEEVHECGSMQPESSERIVAVMEKYKNVFYISGHMHEGINGDYTQDNLGFRNIETVNGVTYVSLPSYLLFNRYGYMGNGMGMQMEVYENEVIFRTRNFSAGDRYQPDNYTYSVPLV